MKKAFPAPHEVVFVFNARPRSRDLRTRWSVHPPKVTNHRSVSHPPAPDDSTPRYESYYKACWVIDSCVEPDIQIQMTWKQQVETSQSLLSLQDVNTSSVFNFLSFIFLLVISQTFRNVAFILFTFVHFLCFKQGRIYRGGVGWQLPP